MRPNTALSSFSFKRYKEMFEDPQEIDEELT
jgi:hypothetical protein